MRGLCVNMLQICRTCLIEITDKNFILLKSDAKSLEIKAELSLCVPEMTVDLVEDPVLCTTCVNAVHSAFGFKNQCLSTEKRIRSYMQSLHLSTKTLILTEMCKRVSESSLHSPVQPKSEAIGFSVDVASVEIIEPIEASDVAIAVDEVDVYTHEQFETFFQINKNDVIIKEENCDFKCEDALVKEELEIECDAFENDEDSLVLQDSNEGNAKSSLNNTLKYDTNKNQNMKSFVDDSSVNKIKYKKLQGNSKDKRFSCKWCKFITKRKVNMSLHIRYTHRGRRTYNCDKCDYDTVFKSDYVQHMLIHSGEKPFACDKCEFRTAYKYNLITHKRSHSEEKPFRCDFCNYKTAYKKSLSTHVMGHTSEKPFTCALCDFSTAYKNSLIGHVANHTTEGPFSCSKCEYTTPYKNHFETHTRTHNGKKLYACNLCPYKTSFRNNLSAHFRIHSGEKPYTCDLCDYSTAFRGNLSTHKKIHNSDKIFTCKICKYSTVYETTLLRHMRIHSGVKPFICSICEYSTVHKGSLQRHLKTHSGKKPFVCNICDFRTAYKATLAGHIRICSGDKTFTCPICNYNTEFKGTLTRHMRIHSGIMLSENVENGESFSSQFTNVVD